MQKRDLWLFFTICVICLAVMFPRIRSAQFGLLDDGGLLLRGQQSLSEPGSVLYQFEAAGRFIPTATFLRGIVFAFAGFDAQRWYIASALFLIVTCIVIAYLVLRYGFSILQALLSVLLFVWSPASIETFYTLSKSEVPLVLLLSGALLLATFYPSLSNSFMRAVVTALCSALLLFSFGAKETAIVLPFVFLSWLVISRFYFKKTGQYRNLMQSDGILLVGSLIGCFLYWTFHSMLGMGNPSSYAGAYQLFNYEKILFNFKALLGWMVRDYAYLLPTLLAVFVVKPIRNAKNVIFALRWFLWMAAWSFILLPWNYLSYYLLPVSFGSALFSGVVVGEMLSFLLSNHSLNSKLDLTQDPSTTRVTNRNWLVLLCMISIVLLVPSLFNATAYASEQLIFDRANWEIVEQFRNLPPNSRLFLTIPPQEEYFYQIQLFMSQILNRSDVKIEQYQPSVPLPSGEDIYIASPFFFEQVLPRVRAINGPDVAAWEESVAGISEDCRLVYTTELKWTVIDIGLHRMLSFLGVGDMIGDSDRSMLTVTNIVYGWKLWKYSPSK